MGRRAKLPGGRFGLASIGALPGADEKTLMAVLKAAGMRPFCRAWPARCGVNMPPPVALSPQAGSGNTLVRVLPGDRLRAAMREVEHHLAHLGSAFLVSPFDEAVVRPSRSNWVFPITATSTR